MLYTLLDLNHTTSAVEIRERVGNGANPNGRDEDNRTPLHFVCTAEQVLALVAAGADVRATDEWCSTPLHESRHAEVTAALLAAHADPNARDCDDCTPLHRSQNPAQAKALLAAGAEVPEDLTEDVMGYVALALTELEAERQAQLLNATTPSARPRRRA